MGEYARVENVDVIRAFRVVLWKFRELCNTSLSDAESEMQRVLVWLENEQMSYWEQQVRKRSEAVNKAKDAVRQKKLFKDASGKFPSAQEEEKALAMAQRRLAEAQEKLANTKRHARSLQREIHMYKGSVQRFATSIQVDLPLAVARLDRMMMAIEAYLAVEQQSAGAGMQFDMASVTEGGGVAGEESMQRAEEGAKPDTNEQGTAEPERQEKAKLPASAEATGSFAPGAAPTLNPSGPAQTPSSTVPPVGAQS